VRTAAALTIAPDDLAALRQLAGARRAPAALVQRATILLLAAEGVSNTEISERLGISDRR
jgi:DNA-binding CsgD family transcriptional regulator